MLIHMCRKCSYLLKINMYSIPHKCVLAKLKCKLCGLLLTVPPISATNNGFFCGRCPKQMGSFPDNIYETLAEELLFPCRYESQGCCDVFSLKTMKKHEDTCSNRTLNCSMKKTEPTQNCLQTEIVHLINDTNGERFRNCETDYVINKTVSLRLQVTQCKNKTTGCSFTGTQPELMEHELVCQIYECPLKSSQCFKGAYKDLVRHCRNTHVHSGEDYRNIVWSTCEQGLGFFRLILAYDDVFKSCRKYDNGKLYWNLQYCGSEFQAKRYKYVLEFKSEDAEMTFSSVCEPLTSEEKAFENCVVIPFYQLRPFMNENLCKNSITVICTK